MTGTIEIRVHDAVHVTESLGDRIILIVQRVRQSFERARSIVAPSFLPLRVERMRGPPKG